MTLRYDVACIGNAIVDVIAKSDDGEVVRLKLNKGAMTLIDAARAEELYGAMGPAMEMSGGSAANTATGVAALGARAGYMGRVFGDQLGDVFRHDIRAAGVTFETPAASDGPPTARSLIFVTPDAQRTMNTYLGACVEFGPSDIDAAMIEAAGITYLEGYLWDKAAAKDAFRRAVAIARAKGRKVALTLSDSFCVERHRAEFRALIDDGVDIIFANEAELLSLWQVGSFDEGIAIVRRHADKLWAVTRSEKGSVAVRGDDFVAVAAMPVAKVVDTTGAGDLYASGFLTAIARNDTLRRAAELGSLCAAEVISHYGARPEKDLRALARAAGFPA
jgi:sugar/nucleoside kinase (ribokinase family)